MQHGCFGITTQMLLMCTACDVLLPLMPIRVLPTFPLSRWLRERRRLWGLKALNQLHGWMKILPAWHSRPQ
jgi:hypothetical protein